MEFWGVEVKAGEPLNIKPEDGTVIHVSQAALGEGKKDKGNDIVPLRLKINGKMFVVGSLSAEKFPQVSFDLVFEREFELSHDWKNGSVYFCGYSTESHFEDEEQFDSSDEDEDEGLPSPTGITGNGKAEAKVEVEPTSTKVKSAKPAKPKVTVVEPQRDDDSDDDEDDESDDDEDDLDDDKDLMDALGDEDADEDDLLDDSEEDIPPKKSGPTKKRETESASKTPVPAKKAKLETPQKTADSKKAGGVHTATPHPSKKPVKSPAAANSNKSKEVLCKTCNRTFNSDNALESHSKAKHGSS